MKQKKNILVVTAGAPNKISHLADSFKGLFAADIIFGKQFNEKRIDRLKEVIGKGNICRNRRELSKELIKANKLKKYDLIVAIKGLQISKKSLLELKKINNKIKIVCWTCDDLALSHNQTKDFIESAPYYDLIYTSKSNNIKFNELKKLGFPKVNFFYQRYSNTFHKKPIDPKQNFKYPEVFFAGYAEEKRFQYMNFLASNGIKVDVYGNGWDKPRYKWRKHKNLKIHFKPVIGDDYAKFIFGSGINLCFLRVLNRDIHTSRSVEIPACAGFMLAERTEEHLELFEEGFEAEFFTSKEELLQKTIFYLKNKSARRKIADQAFKRCRLNNYSYDDLAEEMYKNIFID